MVHFVPRVLLDNSYNSYYPAVKEEDMKLVEGSTTTMGSNSQYCLRWNNHRNNLLAAMDQLLQLEAFTDVTIACEEGQTLQAHRLVLAACSSYFQNLFVHTHNGNATHPIVVLKDVRASEMRALLEYMYRGEVNVEHDSLQSLLRVAESLKVKGLVEDMGSESASRRPVTPSQQDSSRPTPTPVAESRDNKHHQDLPPRLRQSPPTSAVTPIPVSSHDPVRPHSSTPPSSYPLSLPGMPPHRPIRPDHPMDPRDIRDMRDARDAMEARENRDAREMSEGRESGRADLQVRDMRELRGDQHPLDVISSGGHLRDRHTPNDENSCLPIPHLPSIGAGGRPESPPLKRKRLLGDPMLPTTPILRTALGHAHGFPGPDMSSLVSLASSMMPLPGLLSSHVPHLLTHEQREALESYNKAMKEEQENDARSLSDISRDDEHEKLKFEHHNGPLIPDFSPYHLGDPNGSSHYSNFVSYVPTPKPEWKRYKQYTKADLMEAIEAVKSGMTALQASRKYKVPSRTLYDKIKKMGINTIPRRLPSKKPSPSSTDLEGGMILPPGLHDHPSLLAFNRDHSQEARERSFLQIHEARERSLLQEERERNLLQQTRELNHLAALSALNSEHEKRISNNIHSDEDDHSTSGPHNNHIEEDIEVMGPPEPTPALGSFSLVNRKMYENCTGGEASSTPLDLTEADSLLVNKRPEIEERA
ncbi:unnamed protein product [Meganyctiphanes norvegica]|uniref:Uncharacterized protein n=1 Tax=Meganyctiphanes norvegica TaxID=48144 RepID=A0AAV2Q6C7_MEGNR